MKHTVVNLDPPTYRLLQRIAATEHRTLYATVKMALKYYEDYRKQAERVLDSMEWQPKKT